MLAWLILLIIIRFLLAHVSALIETCFAFANGLFAFVTGFALKTFFLRAIFLVAELFVLTGAVLLIVPKAARGHLVSGIRQTLKATLRLCWQSAKISAEGCVNLVRGTLDHSDNGRRK